MNLYHMLLVRGPSVWAKCVCWASYGVCSSNRLLYQRCILSAGEVKFCWIIWPGLLIFWPSLSRWQSQFLYIT